MHVGSGLERATERPLLVPLLPAYMDSSAALRRRRAGLPRLCLLLSLLFSAFLAWGSAPLALIGGLLLVGCSGALLLERDYRWALRVDRGRLTILRNGVPVFDASVLPPPAGGSLLQIQGERIEALRCRAGEPPSYAFGVPPLRLGAAELARVRERLELERQALESTTRQLELLDDPDVQEHLLRRLRAEGDGRPGALRAALLSVSQERSSRARAARAVLLRLQA